MRLARGWTQQELAEQVERQAWARGETAGITAGMVAKWERGAKGVSRRYRGLLAEVFGVLVEELRLPVRPRGRPISSVGWGRVAGMDGLRVEVVTAANVAAACGVRVAQDQEKFVASVAESLAEAYVQPDIVWPRLIYRGDDAVGFVMGAFDPGSELWFFRCGIWRLNVDASAQGQGVGRFAVEALLAEARRRGQEQATVLWVPGEGGPEGFYRRLGFESSGEEFHGQVIGRLTL